jgi:hypothetical protein
MTYQNATRERAAYRASTMFSIRAAPDVRKRLKIASAEEGLPIGELLSSLLDLREDRLKRARAQQGHPLRKVALE